MREPFDMWRRLFGLTPYIPEGRATFDALVPNRYKEQSMKVLWERLAERIIRDAEAEDCSLEEFAEGLKEIELAVRERRLLADDEVRNENDD